jgi:hypothetical protein
MKIRICSFKIGSWIRRIGYDRNHYFGLDLKLKLKLADTETTFQRKNLVTVSVGYFFRHKRALFRVFLKIWFYPPKSGKPENNLKKFEKNWKKKRLRKKISASMPKLKLDLGFCSRYPNLVSVVHYRRKRYLKGNELTLHCETTSNKKWDLCHCADFQFMN